MSNLLPLILKKRDGEVLTQSEIEGFISSLVSKKPPPDYQIASLLAFIVARGMTPEETFALTKAMLESGKPFKYAGFPSNAHFVDKHSTGGVGDKITLPLAPLVTAADERIYFPTIAGRALGHSGGTVDKLESIPGFKCGLELAKFYRLLKKNHLAFLGQTPQIAPADRILYALRDVTGTVSSIPLITGSILSKKLSESLNYLIIDLKTGSGAFLPEVTKTEALGRAMLAVLEKFKIPARILMTNMNTPLGHFSGNLLEVKEAHDILQMQGPADSTKLTKTFASLQLQSLGLSEAEAMSKVAEALTSGRAFEKWKIAIEAQGGRFSALEKSIKKALEQKRHSVTAQATGFLRFNVTELGMSLVALGAGRMTKSDKVDTSVGFFHPIACGDRVNKGQEILTIYYKDKAKLKNCLERLSSAIHIDENEGERTPLVIKEMQTKP